MCDIRLAALARALKKEREYILPIRLDNTEIRGILPTVAYLNWYEETVEGIADILIREKLNKEPRLRPGVTVHHTKHRVAGSRIRHELALPTSHGKLSRDNYSLIRSGIRLLTMRTL